MEASQRFNCYHQSIDCLPNCCAGLEQPGVASLNHLSGQLLQDLLRKMLFSKYLPAAPYKLLPITTVVTLLLSTCLLATPTLRHLCQTKAETVSPVQFFIDSAKEQATHLTYTKIEFTIQHAHIIKPRLLGIGTSSSGWAEKNYSSRVNELAGQNPSCHWPKVSHGDVVHLC